MKSVPLAGNASNLLVNLHSAFCPLEFAEKYTRKYGDFYRFVGKDNLSFNITSNPQAIQEILTINSDVFDSGIANRSLDFLLGDNSLILLDGKAHKNRRRLLMPSFHGELLQQCSQKIVSIADEISDRLQVDELFQVRPLMQEITLKVMLSLVFGIDSKAEYQKLSTLLIELLKIFNTPFKSLLIFYPALRKNWSKYSPWSYFLLLKAEIKEFIYREIKKRRELIARDESKHQDIFELLLLAKDERGFVSQI